MFDNLILTPTALNMQIAWLVRKILFSRLGFDSGRDGLSTRLYSNFHLREDSNSEQDQGNRIELLRDVFIWAYERSCLRYSHTRKEIGEPDRFRIRYRNLITEVVTAVVRGKMNKKEAIKITRQYAHHSVPMEDQAGFVEEVEKDLMSLHEGNIGRHRLRLSEYQDGSQNGSNFFAYLS